MPVQLIVRADDAAGSQAANRAICAVLAADVVRNVSVMATANQACWDDWVASFSALPQAVRDRIDVGLHVTLNAEWSDPSVRTGPRAGAAQVPSLVEADTGYFTPSPADLHRRGWGTAQVEESLREVGTQLHRLRDAGLDPVYLDEHMGVGWLPGLRDALITFARDEGLIAVESLQLPVLPVPPIDIATDADLLVGAYLDALAQVQATSPGGMQTFRLVTHPACDGPETRRFYNADIAPGWIAIERERERQALSRRNLARRLHEAGISSVRYRDVTTSA